MPFDETLTAETVRGRQAIEEVMAASYRADIDDVPPAWALARVVDGVPVSVHPRRSAPADGRSPASDLRYAFICDVATREDRRHEGHFHALMETTFARLLEARHPPRPHPRSISAVPAVRLRRLHAPQRHLRHTGTDQRERSERKYPNDGEQWLAIGEGGYSHG